MSDESAPSLPKSPLRDAAWLQAFLDKQFGHADYLRLTRRWKLEQIAVTARIIAEMATLDAKGASGE